LQSPNLLLFFKIIYSVTKNIMFNKIALYGKYDGIQSWETIDKLIQFLQSRHKTVYLDAISCTDFPVERYGIQFINRQEELNNINLAMVIGGDGTFLEVARSIVDKNIPIIGINLGRLGFLTDISPESINPILDEIFNGEFLEEKRNMLSVTIQVEGNDAFHQIAFNDIVLHKNKSPKMVEFETFINKKLLNSQRSDGLIISTPTGSSAYALSAGGPLIEPNLDILSLVSINPHTMSNRPIVISGDSEIMLRPHENCKGTACIICDGHTTFQIKAGDITTIKRHSNLITLIHPKGHDHFKLLRAKLGWGKKL